MQPQDNQAQAAPRADSVMDADAEITEDEFNGSETDDSVVADGQGDAPADALDVGDPTWKVGQPKSQPLAYWVPSDAFGGKEWKSIGYVIDFNKVEDVQKAVKARRLSIWRHKKKHGLPMARPSTVGRQFTQANSDWIAQEHVTYAGSNRNHRISMRELTRRYNVRFHGENRTSASLSAHINRVDALRAARARYPA